MAGRWNYRLRKRQPGSEALGGLPPATKHASQLAEDSLDALLEKL